MDHLSAWLSGPFWLLAQNNGGGGGGGGGGGVPGCGDGLNLWPFFIGMLLLFYFMIMRPQQREKARRQQMLSELKKNDRVVTIGGIHGVVANIVTEGGEELVVIKVDESAGAKLRVARSAIHEVRKDEDPDAKSSK